MTDAQESVKISDDRMKSRVYLRAALPLLEVVTQDVEKFKNTIAKWDCIVQFEVLGDEEAAAHLVIKDGKLTCVQGRHAKPTVGLGFKDLAQMNKVFGGGLAMMKIKGMFHVILLAKVIGLLNALKMLMPAYEAKTKEEKLLKVKMLLYMVTVGIQEMCNGGDEFICRLVRGNKDKIIQWHIPEGPEAYIELADKNIWAFKGKYEKRPYLLMKFRDLDAAYDVLTSKIDAVQATATQAMMLRGPSEYGMRIGNLMKRVDNFMMGGEN